MKSAAVSFAVAGLLAASAAQAVEFDYTYSGTLVTLRQDNSSTRQPWSGTFAFITSSDADGVYGCDVCGGDYRELIIFDGFFRDWGGDLALVLSGGALESLGGTFRYHYTFPPTYTIDGTTLTLFDPEPIAQLTFFGTATLAPVTAVPEPETWALLLAGLAVIGAGSRRRHTDGARRWPLSDRWRLADCVLPLVDHGRAHRQAPASLPSQINAIHLHGPTPAPAP